MVPSAEKTAINSTSFDSFSTDNVYAPKSLKDILNCLPDIIASGSSSVKRIEGFLTLIKTLSYVLLPIPEILDKNNTKQIIAINLFISFRI